MRTILLFRHGKSDWNAPDGSDRERPLAPRGEKAARLMGRTLAALGETPDLVLASPARRATDTARLAAEAGAWRAPVESAALYGTTPDDVLRIVRKVDDAHESILLAGHEPTWSGLVAALTGATVQFPTAAIARIDIAARRWADVRSGAGILVWFFPSRAIGRLTERG